MTDPDQKWADLARASRDALARLGYPVLPRCLPGEPDACGGTFREHAASHLASILAVTDHHLQQHVKPPEKFVAGVYQETGIDCQVTCRPGQDGRAGPGPVPRLKRAYGTRPGCRSGPPRPIRNTAPRGRPRG